MIYSVVPRPLADELYSKLVDYYDGEDNVTVIVDRREFDRRARHGRSGAEPADGLDLSSVVAMRKSDVLKPGADNPIVYRLNAKGGSRMKSGPARKAVAPTRSWWPCRCRPR